MRENVGGRKEGRRREIDRGDRKRMLVEWREEEGRDIDETEREGWWKGGKKEGERERRKRENVYVRGREQRLYFRERKGIMI